jgi:hypothetical protein
MNNNKSISFSFEELEYMLVLLTEGQDKVNSSKAFGAFQNYKTQEEIIEKIRNKCWEYHQSLMINNYKRPPQGLIDMMNGEWEKLEDERMMSFSYEPIYKADCIRGFEAKSHYCFECEKENNCNL